MCSCGNGCFVPPNDFGSRRSDDLDRSVIRIPAYVRRHVFVGDERDYQCAADVDNSRCLSCTIRVGRVVNNAPCCFIPRHAIIV